MSWGFCLCHKVQMTVLLLFLLGTTLATCARVNTLDTERNTDSQPTLNLRPLIGVLTQPGQPAPKGYSYIAASYVKFIEAAGGRVIPIQYDLSRKEVEDRFSVINGVLIPGGGQNLSPHHDFFDTAKQLLDLTIAANEKGDYFPLHGTCLGFEALGIIASNNETLLSKFNAEDSAAPLYLTEDAEASHFFKSLSPAVLEGLQSRPLAMENHGSGISYKSYNENAALKDFFKILSLSADRDGEVYISTLEARKYPVTATQWHPEKNSFEWDATLHIPHTPEAIEVTHAIGNFLLDEARRNFHKPESEAQEDSLLIYNYDMSFTGKHTYEGEEVAFDECYFFRDQASSRVQHILLHST